MTSEWQATCRLLSIWYLQECRCKGNRIYVSKLYLPVGRGSGKNAAIRSTSTWYVRSQTNLQEVFPNQLPWLPGWYSKPDNQMRHFMKQENVRTCLLQHRSVNHLL